MERSRLPGYLAAALVGALAVVVVGGGLLSAGLLAARPASSTSASASAGGSPGPVAASVVPGGSGAPSSSAGTAQAVLPASAPESVGRADAPVVMEVWADFQCPFCGLFAHGLEPTILREFVLPGTARLVFRDFAFLGPESTTAAIAARCAGQQGAFWSFHDVLFASQNGENQGTFSDSLMTQIASYLQLDTTKFEACVKDPAIAQAVEDSRAVGEQLGIKGTPTLRLVGPRQTVLLGSMPTLPNLAGTIERLSKGQPVATPAPSVPAPPAPGASEAPGASGHSGSSPAPGASR